MTVNEFITLRYKDIVTMSKRICKGTENAEEVAHYVIADFLENPKAQALIDSKDGMSYLSGVIWRSVNSSTSPYHKVYRQSGKVFGMHEGYDKQDTDSLYDYERDLLTEEIQGILTDMEVDTIETWYQSTIFKMYLKTNNYSEIARNTGIPRTSVSHAVGECGEYIKETLNKRGIIWEY